MSSPSSVLDPPDESANSRFAATAYHSHYWARALTLRGAGVQGLSRSLSNARVDLNPHQVDAALFAVRSPLSRGAILADEVGLGKTIEAGLVIAQRWAERRRRILLVLPATLRKQWQQELADKFGLPSRILDGRTFREAGRTNPNPFDDADGVVICSYQFAAARADEVTRVPWDLVVMDEAHRMRNVWRSDSRIARRLADATRGAHKLLLTATPLQNTLLELYGLVSLIDPHVFGSEATFREQFLRAPSDTERDTRLQQRLAPVATRTLRRQVQEYIRFTRRVPITQEFEPSAAEQRLYDGISEYLRRDTLFALPASQRSLITLVLRKLLASSTYAVAGTLRRMVHRLEEVERFGSRDFAPAAARVVLEDDFEELDELEEEWEGDEPPGRAAAPSTAAVLRAEIEELRGFAALAGGIQGNAKGDALLRVLRTALDRAESLGARRKAVIFTESRRTQEYLYELLSEHGYEGQLVRINGTNTDAESRAIYESWRDRQSRGALSGSRSADTRAALVDEFRERGTILLATESAAEGVNLQFCSLVVNYDLPWNPQRVEQRIGRCHRYGQAHDVVVVNFLNRANEADQRVFQLLSDKFRLFDGVFGASDEVLGALESGVDVERRIAQVYQTCRTTDEIQAAFDALQAELDEQIAQRMEATRHALLEHFDEEVHQRLRVFHDRAREVLDVRQQFLLSLTRFEAGADAEFTPAEPRFRYHGPLGDPGWYHLDWKRAEERGDAFYRTDHPLAGALIQRALARILPPALLELDYTGYGANVSVAEPLVGRSGWMSLSLLSVLPVQGDGAEEFLVLAGRADDGEALDEEVCRKLLDLPARVAGGAQTAPHPQLAALRAAGEAARGEEVRRRYAEFFDEEVAKLERWSEDLKMGVEREIRELDREIQEVRRAGTQAVSLEEKLEVQRHVRALETRRNQKRREVYDRQDGIERQRDELIEATEARLRTEPQNEMLFTVRWQIL